MQLTQCRLYIIYNVGYVGLLMKSLLSLLEHGVRCVRTYVEGEMARQATLRPEIDWSMDAELPQRYKVWKRQVTSELRLQMAADPKKQQL